MGSETRTRLIKSFCVNQLKNYEQLFRPESAGESLDQMERRFHWFWKCLSEYSSSSSLLFLVMKLSINVSSLTTGMWMLSSYKPSVNEQKNMCKLSYLALKHLNKWMFLFLLVLYVVLCNLKEYE